MNDWKQIKSRILFSYMECDWTYISVDQMDAKEVKEYLDQRVNLEMISDSIFKFDNASIEVHLYLNSDQHFDFDPKKITSHEKWNDFLDLFKKMTVIFGSRISWDEKQFFVTTAQS